MRTNLGYLTLALCATVFISSCRKHDPDVITPPVVNEEEVITTMILQFEGQAGAPDKEFRFTDADGDGGGAPVLELDTLLAASTYQVSIVLLNQTVSPVDTISQDVLDEGTEHQFFYGVAGANLTVAYADADANGAPIGLRTTMVTAAASVGSLKVTLRHQPNKSGAGVSGGDITNAGGDTDIEVDFPVVIE